MQHLLYSILLLNLLIVGACSSKKEPEYKIGVSQCSSGEWRDKMNHEMHREMLFHDNAMLEIRSAEDDNDKQIADIQYFLDNDFDILIVAPNEVEAITPIVKKAYDNGTPVIIFDRRIDGDSYTAYIDLDNEGIGKAAAEYAYNLLKDSRKSQIIEITGLAGSSPATERHKGFIEELDRHPGLVLNSSVAADWVFDKAYSVMDSLLKIYPETALVYAQNDFMALGIDSLLNELGRKDIKLLGTDASPNQGLEAIIDGRIDASFIYPTEGQRIIKTAFSILEGEPYEKIVHIPALTSVDRWNAEILLRQYDLLRDETDKVLLLDKMNEEMEVRHRTLVHSLNAVLVLAIVLALSLFIIILVLIRNRKLQRELKEQNTLLIEERDKQLGMYQQLDSVLSKENEFYSQFMSIVKSQYGDSTLNTENMAQKLNLGGAQLTRKIKSLTNLTPVEILRNQRMETAKNLLLSTNKSVNEIAYEVGFTSPAYLTKCFREHFGLTPTEFREKKAV